MAGTNAVKFKRALIVGLGTRMAGIPSVAAVQVAYKYPGRTVEREVVHGGRVEGDQRFPVMNGGAVRIKRHEVLTVKLHIVVHAPGDEAEEAEVRAVEIGTVVEELLAADPIFALTDLGGQMIQAAITALDLDSDEDDDAAIAVLTYDIECESRLN